MKMTKTKKQMDAQARKLALRFCEAADAMDVNDAIFVSALVISLCGLVERDENEMRARSLADLMARFFGESPGSTVCDGGTIQ